MKLIRAASAIAGVAGVALAAALWSAASAAVAHGQTPVAAANLDAAFSKFWDARTPADAARIADSILSTGITYDDALRRLKQGRSYTAQKPGVVMLTNRTDDKVEHYYAVTVPPAYDPARRYQVRFQLHGGVMGRSTNQPRNAGDIGALAGAEQFYVIPYGWTDAPWWSEDQVLNMCAIVDTLKRTYNIDENRVVVPVCPTARQARTTWPCGRRRPLRASCRSTASSWCSATMRLTMAASFRTTCLTSRCS
jgi:hypothetical protein